MMEVEGEIKKWGNSAALRLRKEAVIKNRLKFNQKVKAIIIPEKDVVSETFGMFKKFRTLSGQRMKDRIRKELHGIE